MEPKGPFLLPRPVPTSASVIFQKPQLPFKQDLSVQPIGCAIIRPTVEDTLSLLQITDSANGVASGSMAASPFHWSTSSLVTATIAPKFEGSNGVVGTEIIASDQFYYIQDNGLRAPGAQVYSEVSQLVTGPLLSLTLNSSNYSGRVYVSIWTVDDSLSPPIFSKLSLTGGSSEEEVQVIPNTGPTSISLDTAPVDPVKWFMQVRTGTYGGMNAFFDADAIVALQATMNFGSGGLQWRTFSLWDLLSTSPGADAVRAQYDSSQRTCVTGFSALLRNTTAALFKSGSIVAGQMTGGTEYQLPTDPERFYTFVSSLNDPKTYSGQLNKGLHWFFAAEKIQDLFYTSKPYSNARPFAVVSWQGVSSGDLGDILGLAFDFKINIECLTNNISMMKFVPSPDPLNMTELYLTLVSSHNPFSENPGHMKKVTSILRDFSKNPLVREAAGKMVRAGVSMIPLALAMA